MVKENSLMINDEYGDYEHDGWMARFHDHPEIGQRDLAPGDSVSFVDAEHGRTVTLSRDEFMDVFEVVIQHQINGQDDPLAQYTFTFKEENEHDLDLFLYKRGLGGMKRSGKARRSAEAIARLENMTEEEIEKSQQVGWE